MNSFKVVRENRNIIMTINDYEGNLMHAYEIQTENELRHEIARLKGFGIHSR